MRFAADYHWDEFVSLVDNLTGEPTNGTNGSAGFSIAICELSTTGDDTVSDIGAEETFSFLIATTDEVEFGWPVEVSITIPAAFSVDPASITDPNALDGDWSHQLEDGVITWIYTDSYDDGVGDPEMDSFEGDGHIFSFDATPAANGTYDWVVAATDDMLASTVHETVTSTVGTGEAVPENGTIQGSILAEGGTILTEADGLSITVENGTGADLSAACSYADLTGQYIFLAPHGTYTITIAATGYQPSEQTVVLGQYPVHLNITLAPVGGAVSGNVTDRETGTPLADAHVTLNGTGGTERVSTDTNGSFIFEAVPPGQYTISAVRWDYLSAMSNLTVTGGGCCNLDLALDAAPAPESILIGQIETADGVAAAQVTVRIDGVGTVPVTSTGTFQHGLDAGSYAVTIALAGYETYTTTVALTSHNITYLNVTLVRAATSGHGWLNGTIFDSWCAVPYSGVTVTVNETHDHYTTGADGNYSFALAPGRYNLTVFKSGYMTVSVGPYRVNEGEETASYCCLEAAYGILTGQVTAENGDRWTVASAAIIVDDDPAHDGAGSPDATYEPELAPGTHTITVVLRNYETYHATIEVSRGDTTVHDITLIPGQEDTYPLSLGPFTDDESRPLSGVTIELWFNDTLLNGTTNDDGVAVLQAPLSWNDVGVEVSLSKSGWKSKTLTALIGGNGTIELSDTQRVLESATGGSGDEGDESDEGADANGIDAPLATIIFIVVIIVVVALFVALIAFFRRRPRSPESNAAPLHEYAIPPGSGPMEEPADGTGDQLGNKTTDAGPDSGRGW